MAENISFDENKYNIKSRSIFGQPETPAMIRYLIDKRIVKNEKQALGVLSTLMIVSILLSIFIVYNGFFKTYDIPSTPMEDEILFNQANEKN